MTVYDASQRTGFFLSLHVIKLSSAKQHTQSVKVAVMMPQLKNIAWIFCHDIFSPISIKPAVERSRRGTEELILQLITKASSSSVEPKDAHTVH